MESMPKEKLGDALADRIWVGDEAAVLVPGHQASLAVITAVDKDLLGYGKTEISGD
jgi:hypothetical protein